MNNLKLFRILILLLSVIMVSCSTTPTGRKQLALLPVEQVNKMGVASYNKMKQELPLSRNTKIKQYVTCVANQIIPQVVQAPKINQWEVNVFADKKANAFALPGYKIGVYEGLLNYATNQDQLAAVVGHELGHVIANHGRERLSNQTATNIGLQIGARIFGVKDPDNSIGMKIAALGAQYGVILPFSREHEAEADIIGLELMARSRFDPRASVQLWKNMSKTGGTTPEILSTHPSNESRIRELNNLMPKAMDLFNNSKVKKPNCQL